jgi:hypothetical protein
MFTPQVKRRTSTVLAHRRANTLVCNRHLLQCPIAHEKTPDARADCQKLSGTLPSEGANPTIYQPSSQIPTV